MKYNDKNQPLVCMMTQSTCYNGTTKGYPVGILWHDTAGGNPNISRYVQPSDNDPKKSELLQIIGKNKYANDWNHISHQAGLNCWVGKLANGEVSTVQTMPWDYRPWGCGSGSKGSCNGKTGGPFWIQFEICDDGYTNGTKEYFEKAYKEACEITAYLCKKFNIDPYGTVQYNGVTVPTILCHWDSYKLGLGCGHSDIYTWFEKFGKNMETVKKDVKALLDDNNKTDEGSSHMYRVRITWEDPKSQIGAWRILENAINNCPVGYTVFDENGKVVYKNEAKPEPEPTPPQNQEDQNQDDFNKLMIKWLDDLSKLNPDDWSEEYRNWAESNGIIKGYEDDSKHYKSFVTREECITLLNRLYNLIMSNVYSK